MAFIQQINLPKEKIPIRAYVHETWQKSLSYNSQRYLQDTLLNSEFYDKNSSEYILTGIWFDKLTGDRNIDFFGYSDVLNNWPGNPDIDAWFLENGVLIHRMSACGDMSILLGEEEKYRRTRKNLKDYFKNPMPSEILKASSLWKD